MVAQRTGQWRQIRPQHGIPAAPQAAQLRLLRRRAQRDEDLFQHAPCPCRAVPFLEAGLVPGFGAAPPRDPRPRARGLRVCLCLLCRPAFPSARIRRRRQHDQRVFATCRPVFLRFQPGIEAGLHVRSPLPERGLAPPHACPRRRCRARSPGHRGRCGPGSPVCLPFCAVSGRCGRNSSLYGSRASLRYARIAGYGW